MTSNAWELMIPKDSSAQSLDEDVRDQGSWWENVSFGDSEILNQNIDTGNTGNVLDTCEIYFRVHISSIHCIFVSFLFNTVDTSIRSYSQSRVSDFDDDAMLPVDNNMRIQMDSFLQSLDKDVRDQGSWLENVTDSEILNQNIDTENSGSALGTCEIDLDKT